MLSPFPGMDPYLEGSEWMSFHAMLCGAIVRQLNPKLRPRYRARNEKRIVVTEPSEIAAAARSTYPDVGILKTGNEAAGATATLVAPEPIRLEAVMPEAAPQHFVEIRDVDERSLVTAIEILSPANKAGKGRKQYLARRRRFLLSSAHMIEIDLLRDGRRVPMRQALPGAPYFVFLSRVETRPIMEVWPVLLRSSLPTIRVPLLPGDPDVLLDLQQAVTRAMEDGAFDTFDYTHPPELPLDPEDAAWAFERVAEWQKNREQ